MRLSPLFSILFSRVSAFMTLGACMLAFTAKAIAATNETAIVDIKLSDYLQQVMQYNESVQAQMLEAEVARRKNKAEVGIFEPQLETSFSHEANRRTNNVLQQASQSGEGFFDERNNIYDGGLESLLPTGGKIRLGYTLSDLYNNVNPYGSVFTSTNQIWTKQYQTFVGATFTQPLLKNGGLTPTLASLRLSALESDIAFQDYRRQLMLTIFKAEGAYWNLYFSQEQLHFFDQSVAVAQNVLDDSREKLKAGQGAELDVLEAQSALALRNTKRNDALQNFYDAQGSLKVMLGDPRSPNHYRDTAYRPPLFNAASTPPVATGTSELAFHVTDVPHETGPAISYADNFEEAFSSNPDYLVGQKKVDQERLRLGVAKNQLLPELNFKAVYGFNGLGLTPGSSWEMAQSQDFPSWSIGVELILPLAGNIKGRNLYQAYKIGLDEAFIRLKGVQTEIASGLHTAIQKAEAWEQSIQSYETMIHFNEELLKTQLERLKAGRVDGHKVLEVEADLLDARQNLANALTQYQHARLQVEFVAGTILKNRRLDLTRQELKCQTTTWLHGNSLN